MSSLRKDGPTSVPPPASQAQGPPAQPQNQAATHYHPLHPSLEIWGDPNETTTSVNFHQWAAHNNYTTTLPQTQSATAQQTASQGPVNSGWGVEWHDPGPPYPHAFPWPDHGSGPTTEWGGGHGPDELAGPSAMNPLHQYPIDDEDGWGPYSPPGTHGFQDTFGSPQSPLSSAQIEASNLVNSLVLDASELICYSSNMSTDAMVSAGMILERAKEEFDKRVWPTRWEGSWPLGLGVVKMSMLPRQNWVFSEKWSFEWGMLDEGEELW